MAKGSEESLLVSRLSALGDVAMTLPVVYEVCRANPGMPVYMLTKPHPAEMMVEKPGNLTVLAVDFDRYRGVAGLWRLSGELKKSHGITHYADLHDVLRTKLLRWFMRLRGVKTRHIDKGRGGKRRLTRARQKVVVAQRSSIDRYCDVFDDLGIRRGIGFEGLYGEGRGDAALFAAAWGRPKKKGERWLAVAPFAAHKGKVYPMELMEKVVARMASEPGWKVFLLGAGEKERAQTSRLAAEHPGVVDVASARLGIEAELALMSHCDVMLSMDSANMHLASLVNLRTVSIWGATHPYCGFMGYRQKASDAVQLDMVCRPCSVYGQKPCARGDYHCLWGITPQMVTDTILRG